MKEEIPHCVQIKTLQKMCDSSRMCLRVFFPSCLFSSNGTRYKISLTATKTLSSERKSTKRNGIFSLSQHDFIFPLYFALCASLLPSAPFHFFRPPFTRQANGVKCNMAHVAVELRALHNYVWSAWQRPPSYNVRAHAHTHTRAHSWNRRCWQPSSICNK